MAKNETNIHMDIFQHFVNSFPDETVTLDFIREILSDETEIHEEEISRHRWYTTTFRVVDVKGMLIGYNDAFTTGDDCAEDVGWVFDPSSICQVEPKQVLKTIYVRKKQ